MSRSPKLVLAALAAVLAIAGPAQGAGSSPHAVLKRAERAFTPAGALPRGELTLVLRQLAYDLPRLHGAERRRAQSLLARPTDGNSDPQAHGWTVPEAAASPKCDLHFCVHWVDSSADAPNLTDADLNGVPDYVDTVLATAAHVRDVENDGLGWKPPKGDGALGDGLDKTDIYLAQLAGGGIYGYAAPDPDQPITAADRSTFAYLVVDNDFQKSEFPQYDTPLTPLQVTLAHEYNHILQFAYDTAEDTWMLESCAVWMEGQVYPAARDYLQYLPGWVERTKLPLTSFNGDNPNDRNNVKVYGSSVWNKYLDAKYGPTVIRGAWEASAASNLPFAVAAYDSSIRNLGGSGFEDEFDRFSAATAEWGAQGSGFPEGSLYPDIPREGSFRVDGQGGNTKLNHTTYTLVNVSSSDARRIRLSAQAPLGVHAAIALVGRAGDGTASVALHELHSGGVGTVLLAHPSRFARITAVLINSDTKTKGSSQTTGEFLYAHDKEPFYARVSTDFKAPRVLRSDPRPGASGVALRPRVNVTFSEGVRGVTRDSLELLGSNGRRVAAAVRFRQGSRVATLVPARPLGSGRTYRVRVLRTVTDTALNPLARTTSWRFRTR